jgi:hypothetical protein
VSAPKRRGFGTIVIETMAKRGVGGKVNLDYTPTGVTWRLTCPAANALEPLEREQISGKSENYLIAFLRRLLTRRIWSVSPNRSLVNRVR